MATERPKLRWGVLATGHIARSFAEGVRRSQRGALVAVASRRQESSDAFAEAFGGIPNRHPNYAALLDDPEVDAIYIAAPHPMHVEWATRAAAAGKHVLCEKPVAMNSAGAEEVMAAARKNGTFFMEAFMYRCAPQTKRLVELIADGAIGRVGSIEASFSFASDGSPDGRHFSKELGGGGILDVGCYPMSMSRLIAGAANGEAFSEPEELKAVGVLGDTGVDEHTSAVAKFPGGITARLSCGIALQEPISVSIAGTEGRIVIPVPWKPSPDGGESELHVYVKGGSDPEVIAVKGGLPIFSIEADTVARCIEAGETASKAMNWEDTLGNMRALDRWREEIGLRYEGVD
jgi:predicted dehydrogenase